MSTEDSPPTSRRDALQARLALEHEASWLLGTVGGRFPSLRERARDAFVRHRRTRDRLQAALDREGSEPVGPRASYGVPPTDEQAALDAVAALELRVAAACLDGVRSVTPARRPRAAADVRDAALAALAWGADPQAFPGLP